ncbi:hypothetical protein L7F22_025437, partial [Adiantum nelumboides]|nr:hypothetical protein [Adiantum nelumboides]
ERGKGGGIFDLDLYVLCLLANLETSLMAANMAIVITEQKIGGALEHPGLEGNVGW